MPSSLPTIDNSKPKPNEVEVSIFGSYVGECIVVHLANGKWMIVDSCRQSVGNKPVALTYLNRLGVDVARDVELIVVSHWHDDHIQGLSDMVHACRAARVCFPAAMMKEEFLALLSLYSGERSLVDRYTSGAREMAETMRILHDNGRGKRGQIARAGADRVLIDGKNCNVRSLSPSDKAFHNAMVYFASLLPRKATERKTIPSPAQNDNSVVLWVSCLDQTILLGADLEMTNDEETGWKAIVNSPVRPNSKAGLFKIPHHGSVTGHSEEVWTQMVETDAICLLTENTRGNYSIPTGEDIKRISQNTSKLYCASSPKLRPVKRDSTVERTMRSMVKDRQSLGRDIGQVQVRLSAHGEVRVAAQPPGMAL